MKETNTNTNTDCRKCKAAMPPTMPVKFGTSVLDRMQITITGYRCPHCGHWNNLKTRKPRKGEAQTEPKP